MTPSRRSVVGIGLFVAVSSVGACARSPIPQGPTPADAECGVVSPWDPAAGEALPGEPPLVAMAGSFDPRLAPTGRSDAESLLFATLHAPLVRMDCLGRRAGGLASGWRSGAPGSGELRWELDLPDPNAAELARAVATASVGRTGPPELEVLRVEAVGARRLAVVLRQGTEVDADGAGVFTLPSLIPVPAEEGWVNAFTGLRLEPAPPGEPGVTRHPRREAPRPVAGTLLRLVGTWGGEGRNEVLAHVQVVPGADPRDLLDGGAQLMITRDDELRTWAAGRPDVRVVPLPRDRVHLLAVPSGGVGILPGDVTASLAREVVEGDPADPSWSPRGACTTGPSPGEEDDIHAPPSASRRLVYPAHDPVAGALAARLVALIRPGGPPSLSALWSDRPLRAVPLEAAAFEAALGEGGDAAYLVGAPRTPTSPCVQAAGLAGRMPWLSRGSMIPLVATGAHLLLRAGAPRVEVDASGAPRLVFPRDRR